MVGSDTNPILYIEELARLPFRTRRRPVPGSCQVYLSRGGRLVAPKGGLTVGELWWWSPRRVYDVDLAPHQVEVTRELSSADDSRRATVAIAATWQATVPVAVVGHRVFDVAAIARPRLLAVVDAAVGDGAWRTRRDLTAALHHDAFPVIDLPEGIRIHQIRAEVLSFEEGDA